MDYLSTRGGDERLSFEEAVLRGLAPNGGLYIPSSIPSLPADWSSRWASLSFPELALELISLFVPESSIPRADLKDLVDRSYATFRHPETTPVVQVEEHRWILELFHGPTFAFKDVALQFLGNLFEYFLKRRNAGKKEGEEREKLTIVGATSGDTGSAAIYGVRNKADISIFILHPKGRVSPIQEAQMTTVLDSNVHNLAVKGTFDDCQDVVKALFADAPFNAAHRLGAVNSINWARILAQITYYFHSYFSLRRRLPATSEIQFVVPTGNFGDILAGYYAKRLGLPTGKLVVATNANDILARFWRTGRYEKVDSSASSQAAEPKEAGASDGKQAAEVGGVKATLSPAMDILVSSNFERLLWYLAFETVAQGDVKKAGEILNGWMGELKETGRVVVSQEALEVARRDFEAERVSDEETTETIRKYFLHPAPNFAPYVSDPHTAVGLTAVSRLPASSATTQIILSTAHPAKFSEAVSAALSSSPAFNFERDVLPREFQGLLSKPRRVIEVEGPEPERTKQVVEEVVARGKEKVVGEGEGAVGI